MSLCLYDQPPTKTIGSDAFTLWTSGGHTVDRIGHTVDTD
jgi:hypothetical protein